VDSEDAVLREAATRSIGSMSERREDESERKRSGRSRCIARPDLRVDCVPNGDGQCGKSEKIRDDCLNVSLLREAAIEFTYAEWL
jgi:hypothetical protein